MRALIVDEPWIGLILSGAKTWEMRTRPLRLGGRVGLIRRGSGLVVGTAEVAGSGAPLDAASYAAAEPFHRIPPERQAGALAGRWTHPWLVSGARPLPRPVPYRHPRGAVIWVALSEDEAAAVLAQAA